MSLPQWAVDEAIEVAVEETKPDLIEADEEVAEATGPDIMVAGSGLIQDKKQTPEPPHSYPYEGEDLVMLEYPIDVTHRGSVDEMQGEPELATMSVRLTIVREKLVRNVTNLVY